MVEDAGVGCRVGTCMGFPKLRIPGGPLIRTMVTCSVLGLYWGPPILGEYEVLQDEGPVQKCVSK